MARLRDPGRAVKLAEATAPLSPSPRDLGLAYYRVGRWKECIVELKKVTEKLRRETVVTWLFLAMAHWQQGDKAAARRFYDEAAAWMAKHTSANCFDRSIRAEAAALLGVPKR